MMAARIHKPHLIRLGATSRCVNPILAQPHRYFSSTPIPQLSRRRKAMIAWLKGPGKVFRRPLEGSTNYLSAYDRSGNLIRASGAASERQAKSSDEDSAEKETASEDGEAESPSMEESGSKKSRIPPETREDLHPFPLNRWFKSEPVLSLNLRDEIYKRVVTGKQTIREVSVALNVTMERIAAVVRLKTVEQEWLRQGQTPNKTYEKTVMGMLPQTQLSKNTAHESINDLPVHASTMPQLFVPTSESRHFTRADASREFHPSLLPADERIPHPELIALQNDLRKGYNQSQRATRLKQRILDMEAADQEKKKRAKEREEKRTTVVEGKRWDFRFKDISVETTGKDGRGIAGVGWRYGAPHEDRKRGQVKIPTKVE